LEESVIDVSQLLEFKDALAKLIGDPRLFKAVAEAYEKDNAEAFREVLTKVGIIDFCWLICRWFCVKVRGGICITLCPVQDKPTELTVDEMLEFGKAAVRLMKKEDDFKALYEAYRQNDSKKFQAILNRYEMIRFCVQFCRWFSEYYCTVKCRAFCPPTAKITSPVGNACVQAKFSKGVIGVEIRGIASGGSPFLHYKLEYSEDGGVTWRQDAAGSGDIIVVYPDGHRGGVSPAPVGPPIGILGILETTNLEGKAYGLKLTVTGGGGVVVTGISQFQLFQKTVVMDEVGRIAVTAGGMPPSRKLILNGKETAVGGYATIGGSARVEGCGKRYKKYKLLWADGWIAGPGPGETYDSVEAPGSPWQRILEVDYHLMPIKPCLGTYDNSPIGDLTRRWSTLPCWVTIPPILVPKLVWNPWTTVGSRKTTLLLAVQDDAAPPVSYFDSLQIWVDNIAVVCKLDSVGIPGMIVSKCEPLSIKKIMESGGILEIKGTAWDDEIIAGDLAQPSLNFDQFTVGWKKNCDPSYHSDGIQLMPALPASDSGKKRIKNDILATWDIREKDASGNPTGKPLPGITPCAYIIQLQVWDNSRINDGTVHYDHRELAFTLEA
jgi:hypothetical protein